MQVSILDTEATMKKPANHGKNADWSADSNPLSAAVSARDHNVIAMVNDALRRKDVVLAFQPVVSATGENRPVFYEGLIRVRDETGRIIPAKEFILAIEETEAGRVIDCLALEHGLRTLRRNKAVRLSINMSARSIGYPGWMNALEKGLTRDPEIASRLILEITESSAMQMPEIVTVFMRDLQQKGIAFALDDFGAGYTAFRYLREFYFDVLKIDGQFIRGISTNPDNQVLTKALISIAQQFDMFTVAESVETAADAQFLQSTGIDCMQGYHFAAPSLKHPWAIEQDTKKWA